MRLREARTENTLAFSEASRSVWLQRGQKWASCSLAALALPSLHALHAATHRLTDHPSVRRQCLAFLRQPELSAPVGGRAPGLRSEGSWLAAELLCAGLEPGVLDRCAGWVGLSPAQPCPRCAPARPPRMRRGSRTHTRPARPRAPWAILCPIVSQLTTSSCPDSCRSRSELYGSVRLEACD